MKEFDLNLETCIRCTELSYNVADGLGDIMRAELAALRAVAADARAIVRTFPATRVWTPAEAALAASSAALITIVGDHQEVHHDPHRPRPDHRPARPVAGPRRRPRAHPRLPPGRRG